MDKPMYVVYRDRCTFEGTFTHIVAVTDDEQKAKDAVVLAELELEAMVKIEIPEIVLPKKQGDLGAYAEAWDQHEAAKQIANEQRAAVVTVDPDILQRYGPWDEYSYGYQTVKVL